MPNSIGKNFSGLNWLLTALPQSYNDRRNFWRIFYTFPVLLFTTSQRSMIICNKHGINELPQELLSNLRLRILEN